MSRALPSQHKATLVYTGTKLGSNFNNKVITEKEHEGDIVYSVKRPEEACMRHTMVRQEEDELNELMNTRGKDKNLHVYKHSVNSNYAFVTLGDLTILNSGYKHNKHKRRISEALIIKCHRPNLDKKNTSVPLKV